MFNCNFEGRNLTLLTDLYEFTMAAANFHKNENDMAVFNVFYRSNPYNGGYGICVGLDSVVEYIKNMRFEASEIEYLRSIGFKNDFLEYLSNFKFSGSIYAIPEGSVVQPNEVILKVVAPMIEAQIIETPILNFINHQTLIATKAARVCQAANGDNVMEFGLRRAQGPDAGVLGARAAVIGGCSSTSNVLAGYMYDIPVSGTHAHSWIMEYDSEYEAFKDFAHMYPDNAILLVDTYDTLRSGVPNAIRVFQKMREEGTLGRKYGIRIDSGDLAYLSKEAKKMLSEAGFEDAIICASNDLDEYLIKSLKAQGATINCWGVGTKLITSYDQAALGGVYKLAAIYKNGELVPKIKLSNSTEKTTNPGDKTVFRIKDKETGMFIADLIALEGETFDPANGITLFDPIDTYKKMYLSPNTYTIEELLKPVFINGECVYERRSIDEICKYRKEQMSHLWEEVKRFENPHKYYVDLSDKLYELKRQLINTCKTK